MKTEIVMWSYQLDFTLKVCYDFVSVDVLVLVLPMQVEWNFLAKFVRTNRTNIFRLNMLAVVMDPNRIERIIKCTTNITRPSVLVHVFRFFFLHQKSRSNENNLLSYDRLLRHKRRFCQKMNAWIAHKLWVGSSVKWIAQWFCILNNLWWTSNAPIFLFDSFQ